MPPETNSLPRPDQPFPRWIVPAGFVIGSVAAAAILWIAVAYPAPSTTLQGVMKTLIALGGAAFSICLTGLAVVNLSVTGNSVKFSIVSVGTIAIFIMLYFFPPASLQPENIFRSRSPTVDMK